MNQTVPDPGPAYWSGYLAEHLLWLVRAIETLVPIEAGHIDLNRHASLAREALARFDQRNQLTLDLDLTADGCDGDGIPIASGQASADSWRYDQ